VVDAETGAELEVRAENVVNATGVWADRLRPEELHDEAEVPVIRPSRGTHIIVPSATLPVVAGAIAPAGGGRTIFVLPWLGQTLIGTTDNDYEAMATSRARCCASPASVPSWRRRSSPGCQISSPRPRTRLATSRPGRSGTCCCAAPAWR
jgi:glycine/D-amino acid oxidase-like deaminating enzyme